MCRWWNSVPLVNLRCSGCVWIMLVRVNSLKVLLKWVFLGLLVFIYIVRARGSNYLMLELDHVCEEELDNEYCIN